MKYGGKIDTYEQGIEFQDFVFDVLKRLGIFIIYYASKKFQNEFGESHAGFEIKYDAGIKKYGKNLFIETYEKSHPSNENWVPSGINRRDNTWLYLQGDYEKIYVFGKNHLKMKARDYGEFIIPAQTAKGFLLPLEVAEKLAVKIIETDKV